MDALTVARGSFQADCVEYMLGDGCSDSLMFLRGRAKGYWPSYKRSLTSLVKRLRAAGYTVEARSSGPHGGMRWHIVK